MPNTPTRERCAACNHYSPVSFAVPNEVWEQSLHPQFQNSILCIMCFARMADEKLVPWEREIELFPKSFFTHVRDVVGVDRAFRLVVG